MITSTSGLAGAALPLLAPMAMQATGVESGSTEAAALMGGLVIAYTMSIGF